MTASSLRLRLLLGASVAILAALALAWLAMTWLFSRHVELREAGELQGHGVLLVAALRDPPDPLGLTEPKDRRFEAPASGFYWQVTAGTGALHSRSLWDQSLPATPADAAQWRLSKVDGPFGHRLLVAARLVHLGATPVTVAVATNLDAVSDAEKEFSWEMAGFLIVLWLVLSAAAFVQVWLGLQPLTVIHRDLGKMKRSVTARLPAAAASELAPLVDAINALADSREGEIRHARRRAADLAHSLKTPLAALTVQSRRAREQGAVEAAEGLDQAIDMVAAALEAELARARAAAVREQVDVGVSAPALVAQRLIGVIGKTEDGARLMFDVEIDPRFRLPLSEGILMEIMGPLLENAARHARRRVLVFAQRRDGLDEVCVADDGAGLSPDRAEVALMRGGRLDEAEPGHGLGLAIARDLAEAASGRITLGESNLGGLQVTLSWPVAC